MRESLPFKNFVIGPSHHLITWTPCKADQEERRRQATKPAKDLIGKYKWTHEPEMDWNMLCACNLEG